MSTFDYGRIDRCDRCGNPAKYQIVTTSGDVLLCGYHRTIHRGRLDGVYPVIPVSARAAVTA